MSILNNNTPEPMPAAEVVANQIKRKARATFNSMVDAFNNGAKTFWTNGAASPSDIAEALGSDAKEVFELHYKLGQLIASVKPEAIASANSLVGNFTMNEDGTVTVIVPPEPTPTPEV